MNILVLCYKFPKDENLPIVSGEVKNPYNFCVELARRKNNVKVISLDAVQEREVNVVNGIEVITIPDLKIKGALRYLVRAIKVRKEIKSLAKNFRPDIVHSHVSFSGLGFLFSKFKNLPLISTPHGTNIPEIGTELSVNFIDLLRRGNAFIQKELDKFVYNRSKHLVSVSEFQLKEMEEIYKTKSELTTVIYNGTPPYYSNNNYNIEENKRILFVGRAAKKKGLDIVIRLANDYKNESFCVVLGTKRFQTVDDSIINKLDKLANVEVRWNVPESQMPDVYSRAKVLVVPSRGYESLPTVILEAIRAKVNVISTNRWGNPEAILNNNFLFEEDDYEDIRLKLDFALSKDEFDEASFSMKPIELEIDKLESIYRKYQ